MGRILDDDVKKVDCRRRITRVTSSRGPDFIRIQIEDASSSIRVFEGEMSLADFALTLTGLCSQKITGEFCGTEHIGKKYVKEPRSLLLPPGLTQDERREFVQVNGQEEGWYLDAPLRSQGSFTRADGWDVAHYSVFKYVDNLKDEK